MRFCVGNPLVTKFLCGQVKLFASHMQLLKALQEAYSVAINFIYCLIIITDVYWLF